MRYLRIKSLDQTENKDDNILKKNSTKKIIRQTNINKQRVLTQ